MSLSHLSYSILDLAPIAQGETAASAFSHTASLARHAESWGYHRYWLAEHHNMDGIASSATAVLIGFVASQTETIRVGSGGVMLPNHSPLVIAEQFGTLESLYPGRIDLGLGRAPGSDQLTMRALRRDLSTQDFAEQVKELQSYFQDPQPGQKLRAYPGSGLKLPLWLLGSSLYSAQLAGMMGLPYAFASHFAPELMMEAIDLYRHHFKASEQLSSPYVMIGVQAVAADDDAKAQFLGTSIDQRFLSLIRGESLKMKPPIESMEALWSPAEKFHIQKKLATAIRGGPERVRQQFKDLITRTSANELMITTEIYDHRDRLRSFELAAQVLRTL